MKHRILGIYSKVFFYTLLILSVILFILFFFFSDQIKNVVRSTQQYQISDIFQPLISRIEGKSEDEIIEFAKEFHERNTAFEFCFATSDGRVLYQTEKFHMPPNNMEEQIPDSFDMKGSVPFIGQYRLFENRPGERMNSITLMTEGIRIYVSGVRSGDLIYKEFIEKLVYAFGLILIASIFAAAVFARQITKPVQKIAADTRKMSDLEDVPEPDLRKDEIGQLAGDVYKMYKSLKVTIRQLETEIAQEKEMEENQRYFFAAASHELKTPIAAVSAYLEGMLEGVVEISEYPEYLRECLKVMNEQNKLVSEILEIVSLSNHAIKIEQEHINLNRWVTGILTPCKIIADTKTQNIQIDIPKDIYCLISGKLLGRAFSNVLMNAIQNTPENGSIHIYTQKTKHSVCLCILNKGVEIPEEILSKIFEPFYREDKARSSGNGRSGLGLTIVKKILDLMNIPYVLKNTEDGVLFQMNLPYSN